MKVWKTQEGGVELCFGSFKTSSKFFNLSELAAEKIKHNQLLTDDEK
jgi:hypothetical protein